MHEKLGFTASLRYNYMRHAVDMVKISRFKYRMINCSESWYGFILTCCCLLYTSVVIFD